MENTKTKKALIMSVLSMVLCIAMLIGMTFAWFTDTASTGVNKIQAGNLKIGLSYAEDAEGAGDKWTKVSANEKINFLQKQTDDSVKQEANILWEPGCTYSLPALKVANEGNLALKYKVILKATTIEAKNGKTLLDVLDWKVNGNSTDLKTLENGIAVISDEALMKDGSDIIKISAHMKEEAGNDYQGLTIQDFKIDVVATQYTYENDSFNNQYDKNAQYPEVAYAKASTQDELNNVLANPTNAAGEKTNKVAIDLNEGTYTLPSLENKGVTIAGTKDTVIDMKNEVNKASAAAFEGVTVEFANESYKGFQHTGKLTYKDCTIKGLQFLYADDVEFIKCEFVQENDDAYHIWTYGAKNVTFTNCKFNSKNNSKSILCYIEGVGNTFTRTFNNCTFTATGIAEKSAIMINPTANTGTNRYNININNCTATGYAENGIHGQTIVGVKETVKDNITVKINGSTVYTH